MPGYVQRSFRLKALGLVSLQLIAVFGIMMALDLWTMSNSEALSVFVLVLSALLLALLLLGGLRNYYPANYILLAIVTILAGFAWGVGGKFVHHGLHYQVIAIVCTAILVTTGLVTVLSLLRCGPWSLLLASVAVGLLVGVGVDALLLSAFGIFTRNTVVAACIAGALLVVFIWEAGPMLTECNPDTFMSVVVAMDASLLAAVALPFFWLVALGFFVPFLLRQVSRPEDAGGEERPRAAAGAVPAAN